MPNFINSDCLLCPKRAATYIGMSVHWLERQRRLGEAPDFVRLGGKKGGAVKYRQSVLDALIASATIHTERAA